MAKTRNANGEGNIRKRPDGTYEARLTVDGRRLSRYSKSRQEASRWLAKTRRARDQGLPPDITERMRLGAYLSDWIERAALHLRPEGTRRYRELIVHLTRHLGTVPLARLAPAHLDRAYAAMLAEPRGGGNKALAHLPLAAATVLHAHRCLHTALADAVREGVLARNVADLVRPPKSETYEPTIWTIEQARAFLRQVVHSPYGPLFVVIACTGMRSGEVRALRWADLEAGAGVLIVRNGLDRHRVAGPPKTRAGRRRIELPQLALQALKVQRVHIAEMKLAAGPAWRENELVFPSRIGTPLWPTSVRRALHALCDQAGLPAIRPHDLRHMQASILIAAGINTKAVSERLGHSTVNLTLSTYAHVMPTLQREAAEVLDRLLGDWETLAEGE